MVAAAVAAALGWSGVAGATDGVAAESHAVAKGPIRAVVVSDADSPVLDALKRRLGTRLKVDTTADRKLSPAAAARRYRMLIVDGDDLSPRQLARRGEVRAFLRQGRWVLALDTRGAHQRRALARHTGFSAVHATGAPLRVHRMLLIGRGRIGSTPHSLVIESSRVAPAGVTAPTAAQRRAGANRIAAMVERTVRTTPTQAARNLGASDDGTPSELQHVRYMHVQTGQAAPPNGSWTTGRQGIGVPTPGSQLATWTVNHTFDLYLDNARRPQGNFQVLTYDVSGQFTPASGQMFFQMTNPFTVGFTQKILERAWWTGSVNAFLRPLDVPSNSVLSWQAIEPATPNGETTYTSGHDFEVGFTAEEGPGASFTVSNETEHTIADWGVETLTQQNNVGWRFTARNPCDARQEMRGQNGCFDEAFLHDGTPVMPNALSLNQMQFAASARWRSTDVLSGDAAQVQLLGSVPITMVDTYCETWIIVACDANRIAAGFTTGPAGATVYDIDMSTVNPIPVTALTTSPNPANGTKAEKVTGTITLARPAPMDLTVVVYSNSGNAVVGPPLQGGQGSSTDVEVKAR